MQVYP